jgi:Helicase associated domain.
MTQEERWNAKYNEVKAFIETNKRNPSKFIPENRGLRNWVRHQQKLVNKDELKPERVEMYKELLALMEMYKRVNQYQ